MSWSYDPSQPTSRDRVRRLLGDVNPSDQLVQDEEIDYVLTQFPNPYLAAADLARGLAAEMSRDVSFSFEGVSIQAQQRAASFIKLAESLEEQAQRRVVAAASSLHGGTPTDYSEDHEEFIFSVGMHDNPGVSSDQTTGG